MTGTFTIPTNTKVVGNTGMVADLDNVYTVLAKTSLATFNVQNTAYSGGADPTGAADCSAAITAAITAADNAGGGIIYFPAGSYKIATAVTYSGAKTLRFLGDGIQSTQIRLNINASSSTYFSITNTGTWLDEKGLDGSCSFENMSFHNDHYVGAFANTNQAIYMSGVNFGVVSNCAFYKGSASQRLNQPITFNACNQVIVDNAMIFSAVNSITFTGVCQVCCIRDTSSKQPSGTGVSTAGHLYWSGGTLGVHLKNIVLHDGDRGILWTQDGGSNQPHLFVGYDVEFNNHTVVSAQFDYGLHCYFYNSIWSGGSVASNVPGLQFASTFQGDVIIDGCEFIVQSGTSIVLNGGTGYTITNCVFGGSGTYKAASNTYDEIFIAAAVAEVSIDSCHFNVNSTYGLGSANPPRAAVYVTSGAAEITVTNSKGAGSGYGTAPVVDNGNPGVVMKRGNIGLGFPDERTGSGSTATSGVSFTNLSTSITIPKYDMVVGKIYKLTVVGHGTEAATTAVSFSLRTNVGGQSLGTWTPQTNPAAAAAFFWKHEVYFRITVVGASGTATMTMYEQFTWAASGTPAAATTVHGNSAFTTFDTTVDNAIVTTLEWSSVTNSPTITADTTILEAIQNWPAS